MLRRLTKLVTNNFGLKVLGTVIAIILWLVIVNVEDPERPIVYTIPVKIENVDYLTSMGKTYEVLDDTDMVTITVTGKRSIVEGVSASDFVAVANMEHIDETMTMIPIVVSAPSYSNQLEITKKTSFVKVHIENQVETSLPIEVITEGDPSTYCFVNSYRLSPTVVVVSGPESIVDQIDKAVVYVDVTGAMSDMSSTERIVFLDSLGNEISTERLTLKKTDATVITDIKMSKSVGLKLKLTGELAEGYRMGEVKVPVKNVKIVGDYDAVNSITELELSPSQLNIDGVTSSFTAVIHLSDYLPDGVSLVDDQTEEVEVSVEIEAQEKATFEIPTANISVNGLGDGLKLSFVDETVDVTISGYADELSKINASTLTGTLDVSNLQPGTYTVAVKLNDTYGDAAEGSATVTIALAANQGVLEE